MRESALVDKDNLPDLTERFVRSAYLLIHMIRKSLCRILVAQTPCHILTYEPCERGTVHIMLSCDKIREHKLWSSENKKVSQNPKIPFLVFRGGKRQEAR